MLGIAEASYPKLFDMSTLVKRDREAKHSQSDRVLVEKMWIRLGKDRATFRLVGIKIHSVRVGCPSNSNHPNHCC